MTIPAELRQIGRGVRRLVLFLLLLLGGLLVSSVVDRTPLIGSPQFDLPYPYHPGFPYWPQLVFDWLVCGVGGGLIVGLSLAAWHGGRPRAFGARRAARTWLATFGVVVSLGLIDLILGFSWRSLAEDLLQIRYGCTNGVITASIVTGARLGIEGLLERSRRRTEG